ncbi:hypothetical protein WJX73_000891 [Symbiochloris irregularis]|uniref:Fe-S oxidoreductase n=1 Tax=Symbiochloris irregularis TaxID=706552 RepID=A0AAW1NQ44_9CHLO
MSAKAPSSRVAAASQQRTSLIPETLEELKSTGGPSLQVQTPAQQRREERRRRQRSLDNIGVPSFSRFLQDAGVDKLERGVAEILQLNIGLYCNQACSHCHVESSPLRTEMMDRATAERCLQLAQEAQPHGLAMLDITGGAPELNSEFRYLVEQAAAMGLQTIDRCNLTVLLEPGQEDLPDFLARHQVRVVASLPCYSTTNVDEQRGSGVFQRSITGLQLLNAVGYGQPGSGLHLDLVYNPNGAFLAPPQDALQDAYKAELESAYGIVFNSLLAMNNMPIKRFADYLLRKGELQEYMQTLVQGFNVESTSSLMCRNTISVGWNGRIYDCDFNQQLDLGLRHLQGSQDAHQGSTVFDIGSLMELQQAPIAVDSHCFGCTAGSGSGCQGATS